MQSHFDTAQALTLFVGSLPTFIAVILAWINSNARTNDLRDSLRREIADTREILRQEFLRVEQVMDARLKHLEEQR